MIIDLEQLSQTAFKETEFFFCCWDPEHNIDVDLGGSHPFDTYHNDNFWVVSSKSDSTVGSLISKHKNSCMLFRGYDLDLSIHSYSTDVEKEVFLEGGVLNNGVYSHIKYDLETQSMSVKSDPFGVSPLYTRKIGSRHFFSSHPVLIKQDNDEPDLISFLSLIQNGFIFGDRSFYQDISRVAAGTEIYLTSTSVKENRWFDFSSLPKGTKSITEQSFIDVENACQESIDKCLKLKQEQTVLPFSSGFDSRRFFANLQKRKIDFKPVTSQSYHNKNGSMYDIDAPFASKIAQHFGMETTVIPATPPEELFNDLNKRNELIGSESFMHSWSMPLLNWLAKEPPSMIFDGLSGDTIGNGGFEFLGLHESEKNDIDIVLKEMVNTGVFSNLDKSWPSVEEYTEAFRKDMEKIPASLNQVELVFLQFRSRRAISPWITMMQPPGHLVVFPYYDLNFVNTCLAHHPAQKLATFFQKECLKRFWPEYYDFPGSRNLPKGFKPIDQSLEKRLTAAENNWLSNSEDVEAKLVSSVNLKNRVLRNISRKVPKINGARSWLFEPLSKLYKFSHQSKSTIKKN